MTKGTTMRPRGKGWFFALMAVLVGVGTFMRLQAPVAQAAEEHEEPKASSLVLSPQNQTFNVDYGQSLTFEANIAAKTDVTVSVQPLNSGITALTPTVQLDESNDRTQSVELMVNPNKNLNAGTHHLTVLFVPQGNNEGAGCVLQVTLHVAKVALSVTSLDTVTKDFGETVDPYTVMAETTEGQKSLGELGITAPSFASDRQAGTYHDCLTLTRSPNYEIGQSPTIEVVVNAVAPHTIGVMGSTLSPGSVLGSSSITGLALNPSTNELVMGKFTWEKPQTSVTAEDGSAGTKAVTYKFTPSDTTNYIVATGTANVPITS